VEKIQLQRQAKSMVIKPEIFAWQKTGSFCMALTLSIH
jgi:hypothetical protein